MPSTRANEPRAFLLLAGAVGIYLLAVSAGLPGLVCPISANFGLDCPGCGITRAGMSLLRGDIGAAVRWNPLILFLAPYLAWKTADSIGACAGRPLELRWPRWWTRAIQAAFVVSYLTLAGYRLIS